MSRGVFGKFARVVRFVARPIASSAGCFSGPDSCLIFTPCGYDDPEILPTRKPPAVSKAVTADSDELGAACDAKFRHWLISDFRARQLHAICVRSRHFGEPHSKTIRLCSS